MLYFFYCNLYKKINEIIYEVLKTYKKEVNNTGLVNNNTGLVNMQLTFFKYYCIIPKEMKIYYDYF